MHEHGGRLVDAERLLPSGPILIDHCPQGTDSVQFGADVHYQQRKSCFLEPKTSAASVEGTRQRMRDVRQKSARLVPILLGRMQGKRRFRFADCGNCSRKLEVHLRIAELHVKFRLTGVSFFRGTGRLVHHPR